MNLVFNLVLRYLYTVENKKRDRALEGKTEYEIEMLREESRVQGFENVTDKQNVSVHYPSSLLSKTDWIRRCSSDMFFD